MRRAIDRLFVEVDKAYRDGANILILSDRGVDENHVPIPSLLAVSAVHQHLVKTKEEYFSCDDPGSPASRERFIILQHFWAMAHVQSTHIWHMDTIHELIDTHMLDKDYYAAVDDYNHAVISGIVKIASKMGISTIQSYQGSQIFEAIGISQDVIDKYFTDTVSRVGGITLEDIEENVEKLHSEAFDPLGLAHRSDSGQCGCPQDEKPGRGASLQSADHPSPSAVYKNRQTMRCSNSIQSWWMRRESRQSSRRLWTLSIAEKRYSA